MRGTRVGNDIEHAQARSRNEDTPGRYSDRCIRGRKNRSCNESDQGRLSSGHNSDGSSPEVYLLPSWVQHGHLALVLTWSERIQCDVESERHCLQAIVEILCDFNRLSFERLRLSLVETHKCNHRLNVWRRLLVGLKIHVHVAALAENARDAWY